MYYYKLINNHYIVDIDGQHFLIDTGCQFSFWVSTPMNEITINGDKYPLQNKPTNFDVNESNNLVGVQADGFIGMDIISKTSLTIFGGCIDFGELPEFILEGLRKEKNCHLIEIPMTKTYPAQHVSTPVIV